MAWELELVKSFRFVGIESWPDFAGEDSDVESGHVVWMQTDEFGIETLDTGFIPSVVADLDFRARSRGQVQDIMRDTLEYLESQDQIITYQTVEWYYEQNLDIRGAVVTAVLNPEPPIKPDLRRTDRSFSAAFSSSFA